MKRGAKLTSITLCALVLGVLAPNDIQAAPPAAPDHLSAQQPAQDPAIRFAQDLAGKTVAVIDANRAAPADQRHEALKGLVRDGFDLAAIGRFVLGRHWREADAAQRAEFQDLFAEHLLDSYARRLDSYRADTVTIVGSRAAGKTDTLVETRVDTTSGPVTIAWRVRAGEAQPGPETVHGPGTVHGIVDVEIDGISMALAQRQEFGSLAKRAGIAGLLETLRAKAATKSATRAARLVDDQAVPDASARTWMLFSVVGSAGLPWQVALVGR